MQIPNGVIIEPISKRPSDFLAGVNSPIGLVEVLPSGDWTNYLPSEERQKLKNGDTYGCVSFSALNSLETQFNFLIAEKKVTIEQLKFLNDNGFIDQYGKINFSDRYTAKMSGTIQGQGNSLFNVANSIRHDGLLPESAYPSVDDGNEYYAEIPQALKDKAKEIYKYFDFSYEWVFSDYEKHLKQAPLQIATAVCSGWSSPNIIQKCYLPVSHATLIYKIDSIAIYDFDSYDPFRIRLASDYNLPWVLKLLINPLTNTNMNYGIDKEKNQWLYDYIYKIAFSIPDEADLDNLKKNVQLATLLSQSPLEVDLTAYTLYKGGTEERLKSFFNLK